MLLCGPIERLELSRRVTPTDPPGPVVRTSPVTSFAPTEAGRIWDPRLMLAIPSDVLTMPMMS
jgi:hypothetical protein